jgi:hypothetical protein
MFVYGNLAAQARFGYSWDEITHLHSRLSAELPNREERQQLLDRVKRDGLPGIIAGSGFPNREHGS